MAEKPTSDTSRRIRVTQEPEPARAGLPVLVAATYATVASAWIVLSDLAFSNFEADDATRADIAKGLGFIAVTSVLLWWLLRYLMRSHDRRLLTHTTSQRDFYLTILQTATEPVAILAPDGRVRWTNQATTEMLGWTKEEMAGELGRDFVDTRDRAAAIGYTENVFARGDPAPTTRMFRMRHRDGGTRTWEVRVSPLSLDGRMAGVVFIGRDVTERSRRDSQIHALTAGDTTGLPTLSSFTAEMERLEHALEHALEDAHAIVVVADIERFGTINELHGRATGDLVLREVAERFASVLVEAVGWWRHGGDAFLAVLLEPDEGPRIGRRELVDRLRDEIRAPIAIDDDQRVGIELAVGVAEAWIGESGLPLATTLLRAGDEALRQARAHPDRFAITGPDDGSNAMEDRAQLVAQLYDALRGGQLIVHYQPKVDLRDLTVVGSEALVRWDHPTRGLLLPGEFLWAVEFANLTGELTHVVLRQALRQVQTWRSKGETRSHTVSVNITLNELRRERFAEEVLELIAEVGAEPGALCLELTEQELLADMAAAADTVNQLRDAGVQIAIDDFGTGYSSLEHLRLLDVDELKIDLSFVTGLVPGSPDDVIVSSVIGLGDGLGVTVTAEGIEDGVALAHLRDLGCRQGQGYLFSPAVPAAEFPHRLQDPSPG